MWSEVSRRVGRLLLKGTLRQPTLIVVAGYAVQPDYIQRLLGDHAFVSVKGRQHTMERCVVAPAKENVDLLKLASDMALAALNREGWQSATF